MSIDRIGRYAIKGLIGGGGMGTVYLARDTNPTTDRLVALKLLNTSLDSEDLRRRFRLEAQSLAELNHPNIVSIFDSGELDDAPFIVMEYLRGETLAEIIKRRAPLPLGVKLRLLSEMCAGLEQAHEADLIHRDIKPANLVVDTHGRLKILDFGIARASDERRIDDSAPKTQLHAQIGTPGYMPPEQIEGGDIDKRTDLFAVGAVAYQLIAYREAFPGENHRQIENRVLTEDPEPLEHLVPGLDPEIAAAINSALQKRPADRCQDAGTLRRRFDRLRARVAEPDAPPAPAPTPRSGSDYRSKRDRNADMAYDRAVASLQEGAVEFARRSAMEALAERPDHQGARQLLEQLGRFGDVRPWLPQYTPTLKADGTRLFNTGQHPLTPTELVGETVVLPRSSNLRWILLSTGAAILLGVAGLVVRSFFMKPPEPTQKTEGNGGRASPPGPPQEWSLRITPPLGGTLVGQNIRCGTAGVACATTFQAGTPVTLAAQADPGYAFERFTDDCAPAGSMIMDQLRTCGAVFASSKPSTTGTTSGTSLARGGTPIPKPAGGSTGTLVNTPEPSRSVELKITQPDHGTITGNGFNCGSAGTTCALTFSPGTSITLRADADPGFEPGVLSPACAGGTFTLTEARQCSATFAATPPSPLVAPSKPAPKERWVNPADGLPMIWIAQPLGELFEIGSKRDDPYRDPTNEGSGKYPIPLHKGFWINQAEVPRSAFSKFAREFPSYRKAALLTGDPNLPVVNVDWPAATAYCGWANNRLPSEVEWEFAARGTASTRFSWGDDLDARASRYVNTSADPLPAETTLPNSNGLYNMLGNVWEWTATLFAPYPYDPIYENQKASGSRTIRGGSTSLGTGAKYWRIASRSEWEPDKPNLAIGFRCAR